ncbi:proline-rich receptor-like protein kinase PERK8 [Iris pallida]|uniref:Proline-rich receptor-like protein kinase PERK8 n=1 Tax=Iris pallida TaxID=29817 RepID=A0AAX6GWV6_IRIPA|nr:proline-rich receptor-like protein kinase PERK8 [Iris pallida]
MMHPRPPQPPLPHTIKKEEKKGVTDYLLNATYLHRPQPRLRCDPALSTRLVMWLHRSVDDAG